MQPTIERTYFTDTINHIHIKHANANLAYELI